MGSQLAELTCPSPGESVLVVINANRNKPNVDALDWAIKNIVHPKDTVVVLVVLSEIGKKSSPSCFPYVGIRLSGICKLSFPDTEAHAIRVHTLFHAPCTCDQGWRG